MTPRARMVRALGCASGNRRTATYWHLGIYRLALTRDGKPVLGKTCRALRREHIEAARMWLAEARFLCRRGLHPGYPRSGFDRLAVVEQMIRGVVELPTATLERTGARGWAVR